MEEHQPRNAFDIPKLFYFKAGNIHTGSRDGMRYRVEPKKGLMHTVVWREDVCYELAKERGFLGSSAAFTVSEAGFSLMLDFLQQELDGVPEGLRVSSNIAEILQAKNACTAVKATVHTVQIQKADPERVYNVPDQPGIVHNILEDADEAVTADGYVVTGTAGEMWPIGAESLPKYDIAPEQITDEPQTVSTKPIDDVYAAVQIPLETEFFVEADYGKKAVLNGNRPGIPHGTGDYVLIPAVKKRGKWVPDFAAAGRIINGEVFSALYEPLS